MGYRAILESRPETVLDLELSARRRLDEARVLQMAGRNHTAIYIAGLSAEMFLKTACFFVDGARRTDLVGPRRQAIERSRSNSLYGVNYESGHGLWFWYLKLVDLRTAYRLGSIPRLLPVVAESLFLDWYVQMRYRPGSASSDDAARFIAHVRWLARNHATLRR